jgi:uncharacterized protein YukE
MAGGGRRVVRKLAGAVAGGAGEAAAEVVQGLERVAQSLKGFVSALNPAVAQQFDTALKELSATVGEALSPALQVMTDAIRQMANELAPAMQALAGPIAEVTGLLSDTVVDVIGSVAEVLVPVVDALRTFLPSLQLVSDELKVAFRLAGAVIKGIAPLFEQLKPVLEYFANGMREVIKGLLVFTAYLLKAIDAQKALQGLVDAFAPHEQGQRAAAAGTTQIKGLEQIGKDLALAAANAQGTRPEKGTDDFLAEISTALKEVKDNGKDLKSIVESKINELIAAVKGVLTVTWRDVKNNLKDPQSAERKILDVLDPIGGLVFRR